MPVDPGIKILLVEDAGTMRKMEVRILKQLGFNNIAEAKDGNDAVEKLTASPDFDLVISDWAMPGMDGHELLQWLRGQEQFKNLPFLMATGHGDKALYQDCHGIRGKRCCGQTFFTRCASHKSWKKLSVWRRGG